MAEGMQFVCPVCSFTVITPKGEEDLMKHIQMHKEDYHPDMKMTPDQVKGLIKSVNMPAPMQQKM